MSKKLALCLVAVGAMQMGCDKEDCLNCPPPPPPPPPHCLTAEAAWAGEYQLEWTLKDCETGEVLLVENGFDSICEGESLVDELIAIGYEVQECQVDRNGDSFHVEIEASRAEGGCVSTIVASMDGTFANGEHHASWRSAMTLSGAACEPVELCTAWEVHGARIAPPTDCDSNSFLARFVL